MKNCNSDRPLAVIYDSYIESFDYDIWFNENISNGPKNVVLIPITDIIKDVLCCLHENKELSIAQKQEFEIFEHVISDIIIGKKDFNSVFMRLSSTSGKNERPLRPHTNAESIIENMYKNKLFVRQEYKRKKTSYLILMPWADSFEYEFRIFVVNKRITAASPQRWWEIKQFSSDEIEKIECALTNVRFIKEVQYDTFIADVYVDMETSECKLIELNPFGAHSGAGSSLFNWETDYNVLHGLCGNQMGKLS